MAIVSAEKFVQAARDNGYAIGGFNTNNLEWTQATLTTVTLMMLWNVSKLVTHH